MFCVKPESARPPFILPLTQEAFGRVFCKRGDKGVSSRGAYRGEPGFTSYGATKAGLNALSQSLAIELAPHKIAVTAVAPGWVEGGMAEGPLSGPQGEAIKGQSPLGRVARPAEVAYTVLFLASQGAEYLTGAVVDQNGASYLR